MHKNYEAMFVVKPDLAKEQRDSVFGQISESINKSSGTVQSQEVWQEKKKLAFKIKKFEEGLYYLVKFSIGTDMISKLKEIYLLNESILRVMILKTK